MKETSRDFVRDLLPVQEDGERQAVDGATALADYKRAYQRKIDRLRELRALRILNGRFPRAGSPNRTR